jgi:hypothetical protein
LPYILDLLNGTLEPKADRISLQRFVLESSYVTKYLSRVVKDKALAVYHVLFYLSWFDERDYYSDPERRIEILDRDKRTCVYCRLEVSEDSFVLDHLIPIANGGTNRRFNLVTSCQPCNERKKDQDPNQFLLSNYRIQLLSQQEFLKQKGYIEQLLDRGKEVR